MRQVDVLVIGAGILGTFHAYFAARLGLRTLLIERNALPNDASVRNFGIIAQSIVAPDGEWAAYARDSAAIYRRLQEETEINVRAPGCLYLASTDLERTVLQEFADRGAPDFACTYLEAEEVHARYPFVQASYCTGALLFPDDLTLDPRTMLPLLIAHLVRTGQLEYVPHTTVIGLERSGDGCVATDAAGHRFAADRAIVCGGAEYRTLFPEALRASGMHLCKLQMLQTDRQHGFTLPHAIMSGLSIRRYPAFGICPSYAALQEQPVDPMIREYDIHLLFKGAPDGSIVIGDSHQYSALDAAGALEERSSAVINEAIAAYGRRMLDLPSWGIAEMWNGYYLVYPGGEVFSETIDDVIHIVTGIGGKGMTTGPGFARTNVARLLAAR